VSSYEPAPVAIADWGATGRLNRGLRPMRLRSKLPLSILSLSMAVFAWAGQTQNPLELEVKGSVEVANQSAALMVGPIDCDSDSDVFFMLPAGMGLPNAINRISADGRKTTHFSLASVPEFERSEVVGYSVGLDDQVYVLTAKDGRDPYVIRFDKDGQFGSVAKLEVGKGAILRRIAVGAGGNYLIGGSQQDGEKLIAKQLDRIFNGHGQMIASVKLVKHVTPAPGLKTPAANLKVSDIPHLDADQMKKVEELQQVVDLSVVRAGEDGNFYFSRFDPKGPVFVVAPSGEVVKEINLVAPKEPGFELLDVKVSKGRLAVAYQGEPPPGGTAPVKIYVYDIQTEKEIAEYHHENRQIGVAWACYSPDTFTFISSDENGKMRLVTASAR